MYKVFYFMMLVGYTGLSLHDCKFSEDRGKIRSKTFLGIAKAMAIQWGKKLNEN